MMVGDANMDLVSMRILIIGKLVNPTSILFTQLANHQYNDGCRGTSRFHQQVLDSVDNMSLTET